RIGLAWRGARSRHELAHLRWSLRAVQATLRTLGSRLRLQERRRAAQMIQHNVRRFLHLCALDRLRRMRERLQRMQEGADQLMAGTVNFAQELRKLPQLIAQAPRQAYEKRSEDAEDDAVSEGSLGS
ncbi:unnamed protein product, partial [Symbiodinium microadriaticum]